MRRKEYYSSLYGKQVRLSHTQTSVASYVCRERHHQATRLLCGLSQPLLNLQPRYPLIFDILMISNLTLWN